MSQPWNDMDTLEEAYYLGASDVLDYLETVGKITSSERGKIYYAIEEHNNNTTTRYQVTVYASDSGPGSDVEVTSITVEASDEDAAIDLVSSRYPDRGYGYEVMDLVELGIEEA